MKTRVLAATLFVMTVMNVSSADIIRGINIDFVTIGNVGNVADPATGSLYGAVGYNYSIGKYEVTNTQYCAFLNAVASTDIYSLYSSQMAGPYGGITKIGSSGSYSYQIKDSWGNKPVVGISWYDGIRFVNWLQGGMTESGTYTIIGGGADSGTVTIPDHSLFTQPHYVLPTENEWYKAAYYTGSGYSLYANGTNTAPVPSLDSNYGNANAATPWDVSDGTVEQNDSFNMMGNVWEVMETLNDNYSIWRGSAYDNYEQYLRSSSRNDNTMLLNQHSSSGGFRVAFISSPVLEALVDINPDSLNRNSNGQWVTVYITLPEGYDISTIDVNKIAITSLIGTSCQPDYNQAADLSFVPQIGDRDEDGIPDLTVKFNRQELIANLCLDDVAITVEGKLVTGEPFKGTDRIRVIDRGK